jgi:hypothetical protein
MLDNRRGRNASRLTMFEKRKDVDLPHDIAMRLKPAGRAAVDAPPRFVSRSALWIGAGLAAVVLVLEDDHDPFRLGLVLHQLANLAVIPTADLLVRLFGEVDAIGHIAHIADDDGIGFPLDGDLDNSAADLVFHIAHDALVLGLHAGAGAQELLHPEGTRGDCPSSCG